MLSHSKYPPDCKQIVVHKTHLVGKQQVTHRFVIRIFHYCCDELQHGSDACNNTQHRLRLH